MKNIYIVRHGETNGNRKIIDDKYIIDSSISLTDKGIMQAEMAGTKLSEYLSSKNGAFFVSPFKRTRETFLHLKSSLGSKSQNYHYFEDPRLVEQDFGDFDFQFFDKWKEISPHSYFINQERYRDVVGRFFARLENGENMLDVYNRMALFVKTRLETSNYKENIIITHGNASRALVMFLLDLPVESYYKMQPPENCSIRHIVYRKGKYTDKGYLE